jgi:hypothetical protein
VADAPRKNLGGRRRLRENKHPAILAKEKLSERR